MFSFDPRSQEIITVVYSKIFSYWVLVCWPPSLEPLSLQRRVWTHRPDDAARQLLKREMSKNTLSKGHRRILCHHTNIKISAYFSVRWSCSDIFCPALLCSSSPTFVNVQQSWHVHSYCAACQGGCLMRTQTPSQPRFLIVLFGTILHPFVIWWVAAEMEANILDQCSKRVLRTLLLVRKHSVMLKCNNWSAICAYLVI